MATTPNMNLELPVPSSTPGPEWANLLNTVFNLIDNHDHSTDNGVKITPAGMNITTNLSFNSKAATSLNYAGFTQSTTPTANDILFVDTTGALKWKTANGLYTVLDATGGGIDGFTGDYTSSPAQANYSDTTKTYTFTQDTGITAFIKSGAITIYENVASAKGIMLQSPTSLVADYNLTLPPALAVSNDLPIISSNAGVLTYNDQALKTNSSVVFTNVNATLNSIDYSSLTQDEVNQIANINSNTISNTKWGYLAGLDQALNTTADVDFHTLELTANASDQIISILRAQTTTSTIRQFYYNSDGSRSFELDAQFTASNEVFLLQSDTNTIMRYYRDGEMEFVDNGSNVLTGLLANGIYTPTSTIVSGSGISVFSHMYMRVGNVVSISGAVQITTDGSGQVQIKLTQPGDATSSYLSSTDVSGGTSIRKASGASSAITINSAVYAESATNTIIIEVHTSAASTAIQIRYCLLSYIR